MTTEDLKKLSEGNRILGDIKKIEAQLENLSRCHLIQIRGDVNKGSKNIIFDIQIGSNHPLTTDALDLISKYAFCLQNKKQELQETFDNL